MKEKYIKYSIVKIIFDFFIINLSWFLWYFLMVDFRIVEYFPKMEIFLPLYLFSSVFFVFMWIFSWFYEIKYNSYRFKSKDFFKLIFLLFIWTLTIPTFYSIFLWRLFYSEKYLILSAVITIILISIFRKIIEFYFLKKIKKWIGKKNIFLIWKIEQVEKIKNILQDYIDFEITKSSNFFDEKNDFVWIEEIWYLDSDNNEKQKILDFCQINQIYFSFIPDIEWVLLTRVDNFYIWNVAILNIVPTWIDWWNIVWKRFFDIVFALFLLVLLFPIFVFLWILIKIDSKWEIFYKSKRVWKNGKIFYMYKLRSMVKDAEVLKKSLADKNERKWPLFKIKNDPRITIFGKFLRRFSIDELPQIFNVLIWDMSFVWPRAHLPDEVEKYNPLQKRVLTIKPWITWLAQINWRSNLNFDDEIKMDLDYIVKWSFFLDLQIILSTPFILLEWKWAD